jgi:olfactory receptor
MLLLFLFFLSQACFSIPLPQRTIVDAILKKNTINFCGYIIQMFSLHFSEFMEIFTLILLAVDHYVAICKPQKYMAIMS